MYENDIWIEITTLVVPNQNDSEDELNNIAEFISSIDKKIPWHISRFYPSYQYKNTKPTPVSTIKLAEKIGKKHDLKNIHLGNI